MTQSDTDVLVTTKTLAKAIRLHKYGYAGKLLAWVLMHVLRLPVLNSIYKRNKHLKGRLFLDGILGDFKVRYYIPKTDLKRLPKDGAFITVSNHPLGGIDGILLLKLVLEQRKDFKIMGNFLLHKILPLQPYIIPVNPFEDRKDLKSSVAGFKAAMSHLKSGKPLGVFPAGEVSTSKQNIDIVDKPWAPTAIKLIKKAEAPVVPIYFKAKNSALFYLLSRISSTLRTAKLPSELLNQKRRLIQIRIGQPITVKTQAEYKSLEAYTSFLRYKTYMLSKPFKVKTKLQDYSPSFFKTGISPKAIVQPVGDLLILQEITLLRDGKNRLLESKNYEVYLAPAHKIPSILKEIGRLREITFRAIGEGSLKAIDLDAFDDYYHHMFLWDTTSKCIVGAYRIGLGAQVYKAYGIKGFYLHDLFRFEPELHGMMRKSIEMGRAFVIRAYQQKPMPLFLLWKGVVHTLLRYPEHKYLIGGVSISNQFSHFSKSLMVEYMMTNYYDAEIAKYIKPKKAFKPELQPRDKAYIFNELIANDLNKLDRLIEELEPGKLRMPVLLKKYIKQNAKLVAFNVDPLFNNAIDGLMYIKIDDLPEATVKPVAEEFAKQQ
jgi:putative hemolysin